MSNLRIHAILDHTFVNGPGDRMAIWSQGCMKGCPGCFNPLTWKHGIGEIWHPLLLANYVRDHNPEGLTLTGGDFLEQPEGCYRFLKELHDGEQLNILPRGIILFTGYTIEEIEEIPAALKCLKYIDLIIDGRFMQGLKYSNGLAGSSNQRFHFSSVSGRGKERIPEEVVSTDQHIEVHLSDDGSIEVTGFPDIDRAKLKDLGIRVF